jgi:polysaccharide biosynthesis transport protein
LNNNTELSTMSNPAPLAPAYLPMQDDYMRPGLSASQIWTILWAYRKLSLAIAFAITTLTVMVLLVIPRTYEGTATVLVNYEVNDPLNSKEFPIGLLSSYMATQTELMRNPEMLLKVVDKLNLTQDKEYKAGYFGGSATLRDYAQKKLYKNLTVYQGQAGSHLIYVTAAANRPEKAALIANTVVDIYKDLEYARSTSPAVEHAKRYSTQLQQLSAKVSQAQQRYTEFYQRHGLIATGDGKNVELAVLSDLEQQLVDAQRATRVAEARGAGDVSSADQVMSSQLVQTLKTQLATQESRLAELRTTLGPRHPQVIELTSQIASTRSMLTREIEGYSRNAATTLAASRSLEQKLQRAVSAQREKVLATNQLYDQAAKYRVDLESAQSVYKRALDGYDQAMFASLGNYTNVEIVSRATPPVKSSKPKIHVLLALGVMAAVGLGLFLPLAYELTHRRVRCRDDFERDNGIPVLVEFDSFPLMRSNA